MSLLPTSASHGLALGFYVAPQVMAAVSDVHALRIPNWLTGGLAALFPIVALTFGHDVNWLSHLAAGLLVFAGGMGLFAFGWMGGGDVKLLGAAALWVGLPQLQWFLFAVAAVGGLFALALMALRHAVVQALVLSTLGRLPEVFHRGAAIPYGVPIAIGGMLMAPSLACFT